MLLRYIIGVIGALIVFIGVFIIVGLLMPFFPEFLRPVVNIIGFHTNNLVGVILALAAAVSSFIATIKQKK